MALLDFIQRLLGLQKPSAATAKERLQLVLAHDRSDLNPELLEQMRREILEVVQKYVEIDLDGGDVSLATEDRVTALVANLPIRRAKMRPPADQPSTPAETSAPASPPNPPTPHPEVDPDEAPPLELEAGEAPKAPTSTLEGPGDDKTAQDHAESPSTPNDSVDS